METFTTSNFESGLKYKGQVEEVEGSKATKGRPCHKPMQKKKKKKRQENDYCFGNGCSYQSRPFELFVHPIQSPCLLTDFPLTLSLTSPFT